MTEPYGVGTATVASGGTVVTGTSTFWVGKVRKNDLFTVPAQGLFARVTADPTENDELAINGWPGTDLVDAEYEIISTYIAVDTASRTRELLLGLSLIDPNWDVHVDTLPDRAPFDDKPGPTPTARGFAVLVSDVGDGSSAIYSKQSNATADWSDPAPYSGPTGAKGWSPQLVAEADGERRVLKLAGYVGGEGTEPTDNVGEYLKADGTWTATIGDAVDFRGEGFVFVPGEYDNGFSYPKNSVARQAGSSWIALQPTTGNAPPTLPTTSNAYWELMAQKGQDGTGTIVSLVEGDGISIDVTDPQNPVISFDGEVIPAGGGAGQALGKLSADDFDVGWIDAETDLSDLPPSIAFNLGNILGVVSEDGGFPTGKLVEAGENAEGSYRRFADGWQICWKRKPINVAVSTAYGALFVSAAQTANFPKTFASAPAPFGSIDNSAVGLKWLAFASAATKTAWPSHFVVDAVTRAASNMNLILIAVGKWFDYNILTRGVELLSSTQQTADLQAEPAAESNVFIRLNCIPYETTYSVTYNAAAPSGRIVALDAGPQGLFTGISARGVTVSHGQTVTFKRNSKNSFTVLTPGSPTARTGEASFATSPQRVIIVGQSLGQQWEYMPAGPAFVQANDADSTQFYHHCTGGSAAMHEYTQIAWPNYWWYDPDTDTDGPLLTAACAAIDALSGTQKPTHILWVQGEQDSGTYSGTTELEDAVFVAKYKESVAAIIAKLQQHCNPSSPLSVPAYIQILGRRLSGETRGMPLVRQAQYELIDTPGLNINLGAVPPPDLPHADDVHPDAEGYAILGRLTGLAFNA
jgi:hypothetical protein